jgi:high affinity Mn2+ porin
VGAWLGLIAGAALVQPAAAEDTTLPASPYENFSLHGQTTFSGQGYPRFRSPYQGANSLDGGSQFRQTWTTTLFAGIRPAEGTEIFINPELDQGFGLSRTVGLAGFSNGEAQKAGATAPKAHLHRAFLRQTFGLGGPQETVEDGPNQFAGKRDISRVTLTAGKFSVGDIFDDNAYAHDPRTGFMNWAIWEGGAFDFPADQFGFTFGAVAELNQKNWAVRGGYFMVPTVSNGNVFDDHVPARGGWIGELETRHTIAGQPGKIRITGFLNEANSGSYRDTLANPAFDLDISLTRKTREKYGFVFNVEQAVSKDLGVFSRVSWNNGKTEIMSFTDIDSSASLGATLKGVSWGRPNDTIGLAGAINGLSQDHKDFIAAGGLGVLIGDGRLNYANERLVEAYYAISVWRQTSLTFDYQYVTNPAYNADRGPVSIFSARLHAEF